MNFFILIVPAICYALCSANSWKSSDFPMSLVYVGYTLANVGLIWYELAKKAHG